MPSLRDKQVTFKDQFSLKADRLARWYGVICDIEGNQSGDGSPWADKDLLLVFYLKNGAGAPGQIRCALIASPQLGLGIECGFLEGAVEPEVLSDDRSLRNNFVGNQNWVSLPSDGLQPGGRTMMWADSRVIAPLAVWTRNALTISVVSGNYPYAGVYKYFAGIIDYNLASHQPGAGLKRFVGIYLDGSNTLQAVNGATISTAINALPPEPTWPSGAFRLACVKLNDTQTTISFLDITDPANDFFDRRMPWSDENATAIDIKDEGVDKGLANILNFVGAGVTAAVAAGTATITIPGGGWPYTHVLTVSSVNVFAGYTTVPLAIAGASAFDTILLDSETFSGANVLNVGGVALVGWGEYIPTLTHSGGITLDITTTTNTIRLIRILNTNAGTTAICVRVGDNETLLDSLIVQKSSGAATTSVGVRVIGTSAGVLLQTVLRNLRVSVSAGTTKYGVLIDTAASNVLIDGGVYSGDTADIRVNHASAVVHLNGPILRGGGLSIAAGTVTGHYYDGNDNLVIVDTTARRNTGVWLDDISLGLLKKYALLGDAITAAGTGDVIPLDAGTYTFTANIDINQNVLVIGQGQGKTIINTVTNSLTLITMSAAGARLMNLSVTNSGAGSGGAGVFWTASSIVIQDVDITVSGAGTTNYGYGPSGAVTGSIVNVNAVVSGGTSNYAAAFVVGNSTTEIVGGSLSGATQDIYGTISGAALTTRNVKLLNNLVSFSGTLTGFYAYLGDIRMFGPGNTQNVIRFVLTAARTYYVRTDGSDSNTGLVNSAGGAFLTIQKAIDIASNLDNAGFDITIQVVTGTYTGASTLKSFVGSGKIIIVGDETTLTNIVISTTSANCFTGVSIVGVYSLRGMQLGTTTSGQGIQISLGTVLEYQNLRFAACANAHINVISGAKISATGNYTIAGNAVRHFSITVAGILICQSRTVTLTGTPAFSIAFLDASALAACGLTSNTYSGSATGPRYTVTQNANVNVAGAGTTYLPGNAAHATPTGTGGQYN